MALLTFTSKGIYCPQADVYLDPWKPVNKAIISHGHSDHARWGNKHYITHRLTAPIIDYRLGGNLSLQVLEYNESILINGVKFSLHPAGHIIGSAQIRVEYRGEVWVFSGDYKTKPDNTASPFEPIKCHSFITESTFGLPIYKWKADCILNNEINAWWQKNKEDGKVSIISGYSLGKAQRIINALDLSIGRIYTHGAVENINEIFRTNDCQLAPTIRVTSDILKKEYEGHIVVAPPSALNSSWVKKFTPLQAQAVASGWMAIRGAKRRRNVDTGFVISDHADWEGLNDAVFATGAENIYVTHGYTDIYANYLKEKGLNAVPLKTEYEGELAEIGEGESELTKEAV